MFRITGPFNNLKPLLNVFLLEVTWPRISFAKVAYNPICTFIMIDGLSNR